MFVARRKLVWLLSVLSVFVIVMTVNHYFYLDPNSSSSGSGGMAPIPENAAKRTDPDEMQRELALEMTRKESRFMKMKMVRKEEAEKGALIDGADDGYGGVEEQEVEPVQVG